MKRYRLVFAVPVLFAVAACNDPGDQASRTAPATSPEPATAPITGQVQQPVADQHEALGVLNAINANEIALSQQLIERGITGPLAEFAQQMIDQHRENRDRTAELGATTTGAQIEVQRAKGQAALDALAREKDKSAYMNAYIAAMVRDHADALAILDAELIPAARDLPVRQHLEQTRAHVARHLERAQSLAGARY